MAKTSSTIHISDDFWKEIKEYQEKYELSSRNDAIERMLLERRTMLAVLNSNLNISVKDPIQCDKIEDAAVNEDFIDDTILNDIFDTMPED